VSIKNITVVMTELEKHIIREILIPRIKALPETESYKGNAYDYYLNLLKDESTLEVISMKTCGFIYKTFCGYPQDILDDMMSDIVSATIQDKTNGYRKLKKSTHGFWKDRFGLNPENSSFSTSFSNVCFRAVQTAAKTLETRKRHETNDFMMKTERGDDLSYIETVKDDRNTDEKTGIMAGYDKIIYEMYDYVLNQTDLDEVSKMIFKVWFSKKEERMDFSVPVRMSSEVYPVVRAMLIEKGEKTLSSGSLHIRWKRAFQRIREFLD